MPEAGGEGPVMAGGPESAGGTKPAKGPPRWMFAAGCGCLLPGFVLVAIIAWSMESFGTLAIQAKSWTSLALILPYDDSARGEPTGLPDDLDTTRDESRTPGEFELLFGGPIPFSGGVEAYWFGRDVPDPFQKDRTLGTDPLVVTIVKLLADQADAATESRSGTPAHIDLQIEVQGRSLRARRIPEMVSDRLLIRFNRYGIPRLREVRGAGAVVWLRESFEDLDHADDLFDLLVFFQRPDASQPIRDDEIRGFLTPFDLSATLETSEESAVDAAAPADDPDEPKEQRGEQAKEQGAEQDKER